MVDFKDADFRRQRGAVGERVEAGAQDHVLGDVPLHRAGQAVLGVPAPASHLRPGGGQHQVSGVPPMVVDELVRLLAEQGRGQLVSEDAGRLVDDEVGRAGGRRHERRLTRQVLYLHAAEII